MCCGRKPIHQRVDMHSRSPPLRVDVPRTVSFVYIGNTALAVRGPVSGRDYHFDRPGARIEVDARDRILLASVRQLRQVM